MPEITQEELDRLRKSDTELHSLSKEYNDFKSKYDSESKRLAALEAANEKLKGEVKSTQEVIGQYQKKEKFNTVMNDVDAYKSEMIQKERERVKLEGGDPSSVLDLSDRFIASYANELASLDPEKNTTEEYKKTINDVLGRAYKEQEDTFNELGVQLSPKSQSNVVNFPENTPAPNSSGGVSVPVGNDPGSWLKNRTRERFRGFTPSLSQGNK